MSEPEPDPSTDEEPIDPDAWLREQARPSVERQHQIARLNAINQAERDDDEEQTK